MKIFLFLTACCFLIVIMATTMSEPETGTMIGLTFIFLVPYWGPLWLLIFTILLLNIFAKRKRAREAEMIDETV